MVNRHEFMNGLKSLTIVKIGEMKWHWFPGYFRRTYVTNRGSRSGAPLLSLGGIDFVKTTGAPFWSNQSFAELEVLDFVGGSPWAGIQPYWTMGSQTCGWEPIEDNLPTQVHLGPRKECVRRAKWRCYTTNLETDIWYAI